MRKTMSRLTRAAATTAAIVLALSAIVVGIPGTAYAANEASVSPKACQSTSAALEMEDHTSREWNCSGTWYVTGRGLHFYAGGWSGLVDTQYGNYLFCDWDSFDLPRIQVYRVILNETKPSRCA
jgi:hypothetical protein